MYLDEEVMSTKADLSNNILGLR